MGEWVFVYGTLRRQALPAMNAVLMQFARFVDEGWAPGRLYDLGPYPGMVPDEGGQWHVRGEVYVMHQPARLLQLLDRYEGCAPEDPRPHEYRRERREVVLGDGTRGYAWLYLLNDEPALARLIPSGDYLHRTEPGSWPIARD